MRSFFVKSRRQYLTVWTQMIAERCAPAYRQAGMTGISGNQRAPSADLGVPITCGQY